MKELISNGSNYLLIYLLGSLRKINWNVLKQTVRQVGICSRRSLMDEIIEYETTVTTFYESPYDTTYKSC